VRVIVVSSSFVEKSEHEYQDVIQAVENIKISHQVFTNMKLQRFRNYNQSVGLSSTVVGIASANFGDFRAAAGIE
jgi:hypothetical protein